MYSLSGIIVDHEENVQVCEFESYFLMPTVLLQCLSKNLFFNTYCMHGENDYLWLFFPWCAALMMFLTNVDSILLVCTSDLLMLLPLVVHSFVTWETMKCTLCGRSTLGITGEESFPPTSEMSSSSSTPWKTTCSLFRSWKNPRYVPRREDNDITLH